MSNTQFGSNLRVALKAKGLTMSDLAEKIGVSQQTVSRWAMGHAPTADYLILLSEILGMSIDDLLRRDITAEAVLSKDDQMKEIRHELDEIRAILRKMQAN